MPGTPCGGTSMARMPRMSHACGACRPAHTAAADTHMSPSLAHRRRRFLAQAPISSEFLVPYSKEQGNITNFPYLPGTCDNDLTRSPLRLQYETTRIDNNNGNVEYCWSVYMEARTQCALQAENKTCCRQNLGAVEFEIREFVPQ